MKTAPPTRPAATNRTIISVISVRMRALILAAVGSSADGAKTRQHFVLAGLPGGGNFRFAQRLSQQHNFVAGLIARRKLHVSGLHADFKNAGRIAVHKAWPDAQAIGIAAQNDAVLRGGK